MFIDSYNHLVFVLENINLFKKEILKMKMQKLLEAVDEFFIFSKNCKYNECQMCELNSEKDKKIYVSCHKNNCQYWKLIN